jgi:hypothetical protein
MVPGGTLASGASVFPGRATEGPVMDDTRFDTWVRVVGGSVTRRGALGLLAGLVGLGLSETAAKRRQGKRRRRQRDRRVATEKANEKVTLCHRTGNGSFHPITVGVSAVPAHLNHGDFPRASAEANGCCTDADCTHLDGGANGQVCNQGTGACCLPLSPQQIIERCAQQCTCGDIETTCGLVSCNAAMACPVGMSCVSAASTSGAFLQCCPPPGSGGGGGGVGGVGSGCGNPIVCPGTGGGSGGAGNPGGGGGCGGDAGTGCGGGGGGGGNPGCRGAGTSCAVDTECCSGHCGSAPGMPLCVSEIGAQVCCP